MANYYAAARTNYFRVKDKDKFVEAMGLWYGAEVIEGIGKKGNRLYGLLFDESGIPSSKEVDGEIVDADIFNELKKHLPKGEVAIFMESGHEKLRYVTGYAIAVSPGRRDLCISIDDIYKTVKQKWKGSKPTTATY